MMGNVVLIGKGTQGINTCFKSENTLSEAIIMWLIVIKPKSNVNLHTN